MSRVRLADVSAARNQRKTEDERAIGGLKGLLNVCRGWNIAWIFRHKDQTFPSPMHLGNNAHGYRGLLHARVRRAARVHVVETIPPRENVIPTAQSPSPRVDGVILRKKPPFLSPTEEGRDGRERMDGGAIMLSFIKFRAESRHKGIASGNRTYPPLRGKKRGSRAFYFHKRRRDKIDTSSG